MHDNCVVVFHGRVITVVHDETHHGCSDHGWNLVRLRSWCWKIHFETKKQLQKWEDWSFVHFVWNGTGLYYCQQIVACPSSKTFV